MKTTQDALKEIEPLLEKARLLLAARIRDSYRHEILDLTDTLYVVEWHDRSETPPAGLIWASDGHSLWTLRSFGEPIPATAVAVKFWTTALIPKPPLMSGE